MIRGPLGQPPEENAPLARLVRAGWSEGPAAPDVDRLLAALRPGLGRVDRELEALAARPGWRSALQSLFAPAAVGGLAGAAAVAVLALVMLSGEPAVSPTEASAPRQIAEARTVSLDDASPISDLHSSQPLLVFEGDDGSTVIWVVEGNDDSSSRRVATPGNA